MFLTWIQGNTPGVPVENLRISRFVMVVIAGPISRLWSSNSTNPSAWPGVVASIVTRNHFAMVLIKNFKATKSLRDNS